jgi:hypothetical protein
MDPRNRNGVVLLVLSLAAAGSLAAWAVVDGSRTATTPATVHTTVVHETDANRTLYFEGNVTVAAADAHALGALLEAGRRGGFDVVVDGSYWEPFVVQVGSHENQGACGWSFRVNGAWSARGAASTPLADGDRLEWYWGCGG